MLLLVKLRLCPFDDLLFQKGVVVLVDLPFVEKSTNSLEVVGVPGCHTARAKRAGALPGCLLGSLQETLYDPMASKRFILFGYCLVLLRWTVHSHPEISPRTDAF